jgi:hypothetical protein
MVMASRGLNSGTDATLAKRNVADQVRDAYLAGHPRRYFVLLIRVFTSRTSKTDAPSTVLSPEDHISAIITLLKQEGKQERRTTRHRLRRLQ